MLTQRSSLGNVMDFYTQYNSLCDHRFENIPSHIIMQLFWAVSLKSVSCALSLSHRWATFSHMYIVHSLGNQLTNEVKANESRAHSHTMHRCHITSSGSLRTEYHSEQYITKFGRSPRKQTDCFILSVVIARNGQYQHSIWEVFVFERKVSAHFSRCVYAWYSVFLVLLLYSYYLTLLLVVSSEDNLSLSLCVRFLALVRACYHINV